MPDLDQYDPASFPPVLRWQVMAFMRCEWPSYFQGYNRYAPSPAPDAAAPTHIALHAGDSLIAYATVIRLPVTHAGADYAVAGLSHVFTFPPYRRQGYGHAVVDRATTFILSSDADVGILFCPRPCIPFFRVAGWSPVPAPTYVGQPDSAQAQATATLLLFASTRGMAAAAAFYALPLNVVTAW